MAATSLLYKWLGRKMDESWDRENADEAARMRAQYSIEAPQPELTVTGPADSEGWSPAAMQTDSKKLYAPASTNMWRWNPEGASFVTKANADYATAPRIAEQKFNTELGQKRQLLSGAGFSPQEVNRIIGLREGGFASEGAVNRDIEDVAIRPTVAQAAIAEEANKQKARELLAMKYAEEERLKGPIVRTQADVSHANRGLLEDELANIPTRRLLSIPQSVGDAAQYGLNTEIARNVYGGRPQADDKGWYVMDKDGRYTFQLNPNDVNSMSSLLGGGGDALGAAAEGLGIKKAQPSMTIRGFTPAPASSVPTVATPVTTTGRQLVGQYGGTRQLNPLQRVQAYMSHPSYPSGQYPGDTQAALDLEAWRQKFYLTPEEQFAEKVLREQGAPDYFTREAAKKKQAEENIRRNLIAPSVLLSR